MNAEQVATASIALEMMEVTVVSHRDPDLAVLEGVNWTVAVGDYWVIGGLQAAGKSDLLATAAGLLPPRHGVYRVFGHEPAAGFEQELLSVRLQVGLVFDGGRLLNHLSIAENIALPIRYHQNLTFADCQDQVQTLLELAQLTHLAHRLPSTVTRNDQQRVGLARALILRPQVLLLDNPLTGLDPRDAAWWLNLLDRLSQGHPLMESRPLTLVVTADDFRPWRFRARQFAVLREKRFIPLGGPDTLAGHAEPLLKELLST